MHIKPIILNKHGKSKKTCKKSGICGKKLKQEMEKRNEAKKYQRKIRMQKPQKPQKTQETNKQ